MWYMSLLSPLAAEKDSGGTDLSLFVQFLLTAGSSTALVAIINAIVGRRKTKNEADSIVHDMMESTLTSSVTWQDRLEKRLDDAETRAEEAEKRARGAEDRARSAETTALELREEIKRLLFKLNIRETEISNLTQQLLSVSSDISAQASKIEQASGRMIKHSEDNSAVSSDFTNDEGVK